MDNQLILEWVGYVGSVVIAISLMMSSILKLRWLNLAGAAIFSVYGLLIGALPVALLNLFITIINAYHLFKIYSQKDFLKILHIRTENRYLEFLIDYYRSDINYFFPGFYESFKDQLYNPKEFLCFLILRNAEVAGIFIGKKVSERELFVEMDFALPQYRDLSLGNYVYKQNQRYFENLGVSILSANPKSYKHYQYLKKMGFEEEQRDNKVILIKEIK